MMDSINESIAILLREFKKRNGEDSKLEDGDEIAGVLNDGVIILGIENGELKIKILAGEPYKLDMSLNILEKQEG